MGKTIEATVVWQRETVFEGRANSNIPVMLDGQTQAGASPMELIALGLAGCTAMDVVDILRKKRQDVTALAVQVSGERSDDHPRRYTRMTVKYSVTGRAVDPAAVARAIELSETKYCSVSATLQNSVTMQSTYEIQEVQPA